MKSFARLAREVIAPPNVLARWGGDEFSLLYYGDIDDVLSKLELLQSYIDNVGRSAGIKATLSIGITDLRHNDTVKDLLRRADEALYATKAKGRDGITADLKNMAKVT